MSSRSRSGSPAVRTMSRSPSRVSKSPSPARTRSIAPSSRSRSRAGSRSKEKKFPEGDREKPEPSNCLGVFGLNYSTSEETLERKFSQYGRLEKINLVLDGPSRGSRGFGFVYYENVEDAGRAREAMDGAELEGFKLRVDFSLTKSAHKPTPGVYYHRGKVTYRCILI